MKTYGGVAVRLHVLLNFGGKVSGKIRAPAPLPAVKVSRYFAFCIGEWMGSRNHLDAMEVRNIS
jgi:hypothetical protein